MKMIRKLLGHKDDPLMERADTLVQIAHGNAVSTFAPLLEQFPSLREVDIKHFDFILTIAGVFIAATRLRNLRLGEHREQMLMDKVSVRLTEWNPQNGPRGFDHCKSFFERNFDGLTKIEHEPKYVASDAVGMWIAWDILDQFPETEEERKLVRTVGVMITHEFFDWWSG